MGRNERITVQQMIPASRVKTPIEISFQESRRMNNPDVDTGHLLLGLVRQVERLRPRGLRPWGSTSRTFGG
ncbi:MAG: hypothetical protein ACYDC5_04160 [Candidatus Dormibacteria bacterium]